MTNDILIVSDPHLGFARTGGVTPESLRAFRELQFDTLQTIFKENPNEPKVILGDLFDSCMVDNAIWLRTLELLSASTGELLIVDGNHDHSRRADQMPSLRLLSEVLPAVREDEVVFAFEPLLWNGLHVVPHLPNQAMFDEALAAVPDGATVLTHACFNNPFAAEKDHSLNFTSEQVSRFKLVISGHEHNTRKGGNVLMAGSLLPCAIGEASVDKAFWRLQGGALTATTTYYESLGYAAVNWQNLTEPLPDSVKFIRVVGTAEPEQGALVIQEVNKLRRNSKAYFITNSVTVAGIELQALENAAKNVDTFDAEAAFWTVLDQKFVNRIKAVVEAQETVNEN